MIVVDSSVWVASLRSTDSPEGPVLKALLDADEVALPYPVRVELLSGASNQDRPRLRRGLSALPVIYPTDETWQTIDLWTERASRAGRHFGFGDLLIAALAKEIGALTWSLDGDFAHMEQLKFVERYDPS